MELGVEVGLIKNDNNASMCGNCSSNDVRLENTMLMY